MREQTKQRMIRNIKEELAIDTMSKTDLEIIAEELEITTVEFVEIFEEVMEEVKIDTNLYSRQIGTFGMEAMGKLIKMDSIRPLVLSPNNVPLSCTKLNST
jgi:hypothetical protein